MRRALVVANKWWEADPLVAVLSSARTCPPAVRFVSDADGSGFRGSVEGVSGRVEVWCIQEMMAAAVSASSTEEKANVLPPLLTADDVVAFGTAATPSEESRNGAVVCGTNVFLHDAKVGTSQSHWPIPRPDVVLPSSLSEKAFVAITGSPDISAQVARLALVAPIAPSKPDFVVGYDLVALADVNVTDSDNYLVADKAVVDAYAASGATQPVGSLETTHGVIRECASDAKPFLFVSGITDRVGHFKDEVVPAMYQQNFVAAHNAGIAVAAMMSAILTSLAAP